MRLSKLVEWLVNTKKNFKNKYKKTWDNTPTNIWRPPSLSELTPYWITLGLTHLGLETSKYINIEWLINSNVVEPLIILGFCWINLIYLTSMKRIIIIYRMSIRQGKASIIAYYICHQWSHNFTFTLNSLKKNITFIRIKFHVFTRRCQPKCDK